MATLGSTDPLDHQRRLLRSGAGVAGLGLLLLLGACGGAFDPEQARLEMVQNQIRSSYDNSLQSIRPAYVVVTFPGTIGSMRESKQRELNIVRKVLLDRKIPHRVVDRAEVLEILTVGKQKSREVPAYRVPSDIIESCRGKKLLFLNLQVPEGLTTGRHPDAAKYDIEVFVWDDPVKGSRDAIL